MKNESINTEFDNFDRQAQQLHAEALGALSPQTLARLRSARHATTQHVLPAHRHGWRWLVAGVVPVVLAVAIGVPFLREHTVPGTSPQPAVAATDTDNSDDYTTALSENPDLYVWLASDGQQLAME